MKTPVILFSLLFSGLASVSKAQDSLILSSPAFKHGEDIPATYTCDGKNVVPALSWNNAPKGTKSFAITMKDPDATMGVWVHWVVYNIPDTVQAWAEGTIAAEIHATDGLNSWYTKGYSGPCPDGQHRYIFTIYALDIILGTSDMTEEKLLEVMKGHVLAKGELKGVFGR